MRDLYSLRVPDGWQDITEQAVSIDPSGLDTVLTHGEPWTLGNPPLPYFLATCRESPWASVSEAPRGPGEAMEGFEPTAAIDGEPSVGLHIDNGSSMIDYRVVVHDGNQCDFTAVSSAGNDEDAADLRRTLDSLTWK